MSPSMSLLCGSLVGPSVAITSGTSVATLTYYDESNRRLRTEPVALELAERVMHEYEVDMQDGRAPRGH